MRASHHLPCARESGRAATEGPRPAGAGQRAQRRPRCAPRHASVAAAAAAGASAAAPWPPQQPRPRLVYVLDAAPGHAKDDHPEGPQRVHAVAAALAAARLDEHGAMPLGAEAVAAWRGTAAFEALGRVHPAHYLERLDSICKGVEAATLVDESTYIAPGSFSAGLEAMAAVLACLDAAMRGPPDGAGERSGGGGQSSGGGRSGSRPGAAGAGRARGCAGFCVVRPPGHHVMPSRPMGFGVLNLVSAAVAAARARPGIDRVLVLDWDVHHGNGTEAVFESDPSVMYLSTHQQGLWPYTGKAAFTGRGEGEGATINVPLPGGAGDAAARLAWGAVVEPAARRFRPDVLVVSAGYDAHWRDPLAALQLCSSSFHWMAAGAAALADELCGGRVLFVLEGGYHLESLGQSVAETFRGVLGLPPATPPPGALAVARLLQDEPAARAERAVAEVVRRHRLG